jgi:hypothetical protein
MYGDSRCSYHRVDAKVSVFGEGKPGLLFSVQNITFSVGQGLRVNGKLFTCWFWCLKLSALSLLFASFWLKASAQARNRNTCHNLGMYAFPALLPSSYYRVTAINIFKKLHSTAENQPSLSK